MTSIAFGQGPTPAELAYTPPGPIVPSPTHNGSSGYSTTSPNWRWRVPAPFISLDRPVGPDGARYLQEGTEESEDPMLNDNPGMEAVLFVRHGPSPAAPGVRGPYLFVQERIRADGVPSELRTGPELTIGSCRAWGGADPDGLTRLALSRRQIAVLMVSNAFTQAELQKYAAEQVCR